MVRRCLICNIYKRKQNDGDISFHRLPTDQGLREKWLQVICQWKEEFVLPKDAFVCSNHFDPKFFCMLSGHRRLTKGAVPIFFKYQDSSSSTTSLHHKSLGSSTGTAHWRVCSCVTESAQELALTTSPVNLDTQIENVPSRKKRRVRQYNPRFIGDIDSSEMSSPEKKRWEMAKREVAFLRGKVRKLQRQNLNLNRRIKSMSALLYSSKIEESCLRER